MKAKTMKKPKKKAREWTMYNHGDTLWHIYGRLTQKRIREAAKLGSSYIVIREVRVLKPRGRK